MKSPREYTFVYRNSFTYIGMIIALQTVWLIVSLLLETAHTSLETPVLPDYALPLIFVAGMFLIMWVVKARLGHLYVIQGICLVYEDHFILDSGRKSRSIPFNTVTKMFYNDSWRSKGLVINTIGGNIFLETMPGAGYEYSSVFTLSTKLRQDFLQYLCGQIQDSGAPQTAADTGEAGTDDAEIQQ